MPPEDTKRYCQFMPIRLLEGWKSISDQTGYTVSDLIRRAVDRSLQPHVLNELIPSMSGQLRVS